MLLLLLLLVVNVAVAGVVRARARAGFLALARGCVLRPYPDPELYSLP